MDTGAVHASYISRKFLEDITTQHGLIVERVPVKAHVLLGDSSTRVDITEAVNLKIRFEGKRLDYESTVYLYVLESDPSTPIILGLPALMSLNIFPFFMETLLDSFLAMGYHQKHCQRKVEHILNEISDISEVLTPWPSTHETIAPEELDAPVPDAFPGAMNFLSGTQEEASIKYEKDVDQYLSKEWLDHDPSIREYLLSDQTKKTFLPKTWEGLRNVSKCGANENDEFELNWNSLPFPESLDCKIRPVPPSLAEAVSVELDRLCGYLWVDSDSPVCCPITIAPKATHPFIRVAGDMRPVNPFLSVPKEPIPRVDLEVQKMSKFDKYADIDMTNSFHQMKLAYLSSRRLTVKTPVGLKRPLFVPEGISPGSAMLQRVNRTIFNDMQDCMVVMFDNLLIGGTDFDDLRIKLDKFFERCRHHNIICKMAKSRFGYDHANFFGYVVKKDGYELSEERKQAVNDILFPTSIKSMQSFLGMALFFKPFVPRYSDLTAKLNETVHQDFNWKDKSTWTHPYEDDFNTLKVELLHSLKMSFPDWNQEFILRTDASKVAVAGVLIQKHRETGELKPVALISAKLSDPATRWDAYKLECYGIYFCVKSLSYYLHGKEFVVESDHQNLQWLEKNDSAIVTRWRWYLQNFTMLIRHIKGKDNIVADFMSRMYPDTSANSTDTPSITDTDISLDSQPTVLASLWQHQLSMVYESKPPVTTVDITLQHDHISVPISIKPTHKFEEAIRAFVRSYMSRQTVPYKGFSFWYNDKELKYEDTPESVGIATGDTIRVLGSTYTSRQHPNLHHLLYHQNVSKILSRKATIYASDKSRSSLNLSVNIDPSSNSTSVLVPSSIASSLQLVPSKSPLTITVYDPVSLLPVTMVVPFEVSSSAETVTLSGSHAAQYLKAATCSSSIPAGSTNKSSEAVFNPVHLFGTDPERHHLMPDHVRQLIKNCTRPARFTSPSDSSISQTLDIKLDTGHATPVSSISKAIVDKYPDLFKVTWVKHKPTSRSMSGHLIESVGRCRVQVTLQHDITGISSSSILPFRILDNNMESILMSNEDACKNFADILCQCISTNRQRIHRDLASGFESSGLPPLSFVTRTHQQSPTGQVLPMDKDFKLSSITPCYDCITCPPCSVMEDVYTQSPSIVQILAPLLSAPPAVTAPFTEVECKFQPTPELRAQLATLYPPKTKTFTDTYFDSPQLLLSCRDYWLRQRGNTFQLKYPSPSGHSGGISHYIEEEDTDRILDLLDIDIPPEPSTQQRTAYYGVDTSNVVRGTRRNPQPSTPPPRPLSFTEVLAQNSITPFATIKTTRSSHHNVLTPASVNPALSHSFQVDFDSATLSCNDQTSNYTIAEVELTTAAADSTPSQAITDFINHHNIDPSVLSTSLYGKLVECLHRHSPTHFQLLVAHKIISPPAPVITPPFLTPPSHKPTEGETEQGVPTTDTTPTVTEPSPPSPTHELDPRSTESMLLSDDPVTNLNLWMSKLHGGRNLHLGVHRTWVKAALLFPGHKLPYKFFEEWVASCGTCQKQRQAMALAFQAVVKTLKYPMKPRSVVGMDSMKLPKDKYGNQYVHIILSMFSKLIYAYASKDNSADSICDALLTYFSTHGLFDVMNIDPGSNLLAESVQLLNKHLDITQKVSMVDVHTSNGVENGGVKMTTRHLQALCSDERIQDRWSEPKYFNYVLFMMNSMKNFETNDTPFRLHWGDYDKLASKYTDPVIVDPTTRSKYIKDLRDLQQIANEASSNYQKKLHEQRIAKSSPLSKNQYQPGDYVLKIRNLPLNLKKLQNFKYAGPFVVTSQKDNFVSVTHCATNEPYVFPVERLVIFNNTRNEAFKVAQLDTNEFLVIQVLNHKGDPSQRSTVQFLIDFDLDDEPSWIPFSQDLMRNELIQEYCNSKEPTKVLLMKADSAKRYIASLRTTIKEVSTRTKAYINLRIFGDEWYFALNLPDQHSHQYLVEAIYQKFSDKDKQISVYFPIFDSGLTFNRILVLWYGLTFEFPSENATLVDKNFLIKFPQVLKNEI